MLSGVDASQTLKQTTIVYSSQCPAWFSEDFSSKIFRKFCGKLRAIKCVPLIDFHVFKA